MFILKRHVIRKYIFLSICLMGIGIDSLNIGAKSIPINKVVEGGYQESSNIEKDDILKLKNKKQEDVETSSDTSNEIAVDSKKEEATSEQSKKNQEVDKIAIKAELTAYSDDLRSQEEWGSQTAMQTHTRVGVIAAPKNIPLGSKMYIPELKNYKADGMFDVEDRGGAIKVKADGTYVIDVWVPTREEALEFGRKKTTIYLIEKQ